MRSHVTTGGRGRREQQSLRKVGGEKGDRYDEHESIGAELGRAARLESRDSISRRRAPVAAGDDENTPPADKGKRAGPKQPPVLRQRRRIVRNLDRPAGDSRLMARPLIELDHGVNRIAATGQGKPILDHHIDDHRAGGRTAGGPTRTAAESSRGRITRRPGILSVSPILPSSRRVVAWPRTAGSCSHFAVIEGGEGSPTDARPTWTAWAGYPLRSV